VVAGDWEDLEAAAHTGDYQKDFRLCYKDLDIWDKFSLVADKYVPKVF
jgi:hypothetical protein